MRRKSCFLSIACGIALWGNAVNAEIAFQDVTQSAGMLHAGPTYGASWGDLNGDGWPDIWIGNHQLDRNAPTLYLNQRDGTFKDVTREVVTVDPRADIHGATWADFDNDGDQDLLATAGGGGGLDDVESPSDTHLFVNDQGILRNQARHYGLLDPQGRGRTALWLDADMDGRLDVLLSNHPRKDGKAPTALYRQESQGFQSANEVFAFVPGALSRKQRFLDLIDNIKHLRARLGRPKLNAKEFAQLADLDGDGHPELLAYLAPLRIFSMDSVPFTDITNTFSFPNRSGIRDVAVEDFTGDLKPDIFLARAKRGSDLIQTSEFDIQGHLNRPATVQFHAEGEVTFSLSPPWVNPVLPDSKKPKLFIGNTVELLSQPLSVRLSPSDIRLADSVDATAKAHKGVTIKIDDKKNWILDSSLGEVNFVVHSSAPLREIKAIGFKPTHGELGDVLLINAGNSRFQPQSPEKFDIGMTACDSVVAGDFDNDMDVDLYMVCTGPAGNLPNVLLENAGDGRFTVVPEAGGAAGSKLGRGDSVVSADYDRDGFLDLFVTNGAGFAPFSDAGPYELFRNRGNSNHWLEIDLEGVQSNRDGIGAAIFLEAAGGKQMRIQGGGMHDHAQNSKRIHFGLGKHSKVDKIVVRWPNGHVQKLENVAGDQVLSIKEQTDPLSQP